MEQKISKYQLLFTFKLKRFKINKLFYITLYKSVTKRISKTKAKLCSLATKACLKARWQHLASTSAEQRREASNASTTSAHLGGICQRGLSLLTNFSKKKAILTEYLLLISDIQKYSSDCFQFKLNKPAGKKIKTKNDFPLRNQRTCIYSNVMQQTTRNSKY